MKGAIFARTFNTLHGQLLLFCEFINPDQGVLHQQMYFEDGPVHDKPVVGTPEEVQTVLGGIDFLVAEEIALDIVTEHEAAIPSLEETTGVQIPEDYRMPDKVYPAPEGHDPFDDEIPF